MLKKKKLMLALRFILFHVFSGCGRWCHLQTKWPEHKVWLVNSARPSSSVFDVAGCVCVSVVSSESWIGAQQKDLVVEHSPLLCCSCHQLDPKSSLTEHQSVA